MLPRSCRRNPTLEAAVAAASSQTAPRLVYADWLEEQGEPVAAEGYRWLAKAGGDTLSPVGRALGVVSVAGAVHAYAALAGPALAGAKLKSGHHNHLNGELLGLHDALHALASATRGLGPVPAEAFALDLPSALPAGWPPAAHGEALTRALSRLRDALATEDVGALYEAMAASRQHDPERTADRLCTGALWSWAATGTSPLAPDAVMAESLSEEWEEDDVDLELPVTGTMLGFSFAKVMITNATQGIRGTLWLTEEKASARDAFMAMTVLEELSAKEFNKLSLEDRLEWLTEDLLVEGDDAWRPLSLFEATAWLYACLQDNEGEGIRVEGRGPMALLDALEPLGAYRAGAVSGGEFPFTLLELEHGWLYSRFVC